MKVMIMLLVCLLMVVTTMTMMIATPTMKRRSVGRYSDYELVAVTPPKASARRARNIHCECPAVPKSMGAP